jgi:hypothetical protein
MFQIPIVAARPAYSLTKASGTLAAQLIANTTPPQNMQVISFHPGMVHGVGWVEMGVTKDMLPFDDGKLSMPPTF